MWYLRVALSRASPVELRMPMALPVSPIITTGLAIAGGGLWLATHAAPPSAPTPAVQLASVESACDDLWCIGSAGAGVSAPTPAALASATNPISALVGIFVSNGSADHPNAGLL